MPRQHQPPTLRKVCIENIICYFEDYWLAGSTRDLLEQSEQSAVFTPFQYLCCAGSTRDLLEQSEQSDVFTPFQYLCCAGSTRDLLEQSEQSDVFTPFQYLCCAGSTRDLLEQSEQSDVFTPFQYLCCAGSTRDLLEQSEQSDVFTPFQYLCDDMIQEIIDKLQERELRPLHVQLLLHSNIRQLNLHVRLHRECVVNGRNNITKTLGIRCQKLTHLNLGGLFHVKPQLLCTLMRHLPQLLCLECITTDGSLIKAICENCPNLQELYLNCSRSVKDTDLLYLCNYPENPKTRRKLKKLSINGVYIILNTIVQLLNNQTSLQCLVTGLDHRLDHAFEQMYGEEFRSINKVLSEPVHNLLHIIIQGSSDKNFYLGLGETGRLDLTFQCCPFLTKLTLLDLMKGESLNNVAKLTFLKNLSVSMFRKCNFSMYMTPLLSEIGDNLTDLFCSEFDEISLILIGKLCPNLESLELRAVSLISEQHPIDNDVTQSFPYFTNLTVFLVSLFDDDHPSLTENVLSLLLQNATKIVHCAFRNVTNLTDRVISEANKKHGFRHLRKCHFSLCSSISVESIWVFLCPDNPLELLNVYDCENITYQDIKMCQQEAELRQFNISIHGGFIYG